MKEPLTELSDRVDDVTADPAAAMRAFLQRGEVRLSTMHRVGAGFLSGAGLLILLPAVTTQLLPPIGTALLKAPIALEGRLALALLVFGTIILPLYALLLLIKDLTQFYFTAYHPRQSHSVFLPSFSVAGLSYPSGEPGKESVKDLQENADFHRFLLSPRDQERSNLSSLLRRFGSEMVPKTRISRLGAEPNYQAPTDEMLLYAALSVAGYSDRTLAEEVARLEVSLVRHALLLRRLLLRYVKALLLFIATLFLLVGVSFLLQQGLTEAWLLVVPSATLAWSILVPHVVALPITWIHRLGSADKSKDAVRYDHHLVAFETSVTIVGHVWGFISILLGWYIAPDTEAWKITALLLLAAHMGYSVVTFVIWWRKA